MPSNLTRTNTAQMAEELGASAVMVTPSKENVPLSDDAMVQHFQSIAQGIGIPIVLQDHPASTSVHMSLDLVERLLVEVRTYQGSSAIASVHLTSPTEHCVQIPCQFIGTEINSSACSGYIDYKPTHYECKLTTMQ